ncbi:hypothetical protein MKZ38_010372 [Zalerion maritima]|uniref:Uncharacterized protein n=1 Tax=Zalerion maritima TaxID=339359 RepID=A0AAD5S089_9PEZI|nr:hypothetical protein MKZ38_010372 [Zalerion maritima]
MPAKPLIAPLTQGALAWKTVATAAATAPTRTQKRQFSRSQVRPAESIHFHKTGNKDLEGLLNQMQKYIILPSYLKQPQRKLLFDPNQKDRLLDDPITIELDGETVRYSHLSLRDVPAADSILKRAVDTFKGAEDWKNLEPILVGLRQAGRVLHADTRSKIVRRAGQQRRLDDLFYLMHHATRTGFYMNAHEPVSTFLLWTYRECMVEDHGQGLAKGIARCDRLYVDVLEREDHGSSPIAKQPHLAFRNERFHLTRDPQLLAVSLGLRAQLILSPLPYISEENKAENLKQVHYLSGLVCSLWNPRNPKVEAGIGGQGLGGLHPQDSYFDANWTKYLRNTNKRLEWEAIIVRAFEDAAEAICETDLPVAKQLGRIAEVVRAEAEVDIVSPIAKDGTLGKHIWKCLIAEPKVSGKTEYKNENTWRPDEKTKKHLRQGAPVLASPTNFLPGDK